MIVRLLAAALLSLFTLCSSAVTTTQIRPPQPAQIRQATEQHNYALAEKLLRDYERADHATFARNNYDYLLARVLDYQGKSAEAAKAYQQVTSRNAVFAGYALWHQAEQMRGVGNYKEEQSLLAKLIAQHPGWLSRERAMQRLGASYARAGQHPQALTIFSQLAATRGTIARDSTARIGESYLALNQAAQARTTFESLLTGGAMDDAALKAVLGLDKIDEAARTPLTESDRLRRARICQFNRNFADARKHWLAVVNEFPQSTARPEALFQLGRGYFWEENFRESARWYQQVANEFPTRDEGQQGFYYVGHCHQYLNETDQAIARYEEFLKAYPRSEFVGTAHLNAIDTLRTAKRDAEALQWAMRAQAQPDRFISVTGLFRQACIHLSQENYAAALDDFTALRSRNLNVRGAVATTNLPEVTFMRGYVLEKLGRFDEAITVYLAMPEGRNGATGYYGYQASERLRSLAQNARAKNIVADRLKAFLEQARAAKPQLVAATAVTASAAKTSAAQVMRLTDDENLRNEMREILRMAYVKLPGYQVPRFTLLPAGRTSLAGAQGAPQDSAGSGNHQLLADELFFLGLYDEAAPELAIVKNGDPAWTYSLAAYFERGDRGDRAVNYVEPLFKNVPDDYRVELMPRETVEMLYPSPYHDEMQRHAAPRKVDPAFVLSIMRQESRFNPTVKSAAAARGLLQFISSTSSQIAAQLKLPDFEQEDLYHPNTAILIGSQYMQNLFDEFGNAQAVAAAYNGSEQSVRRWRERARSSDVNAFVLEIGKRETKDYVYKVLNNYRAYQALLK